MTGSLGLIADIGATNARFAVADEKGVLRTKVLACADYPTIVDAANAYLSGLSGPAPKRAAFAIAGPVTGDFFEMTNHAWDFSISETQKALGFGEFVLMNDFKALALAVPHLRDEDLKQIGGNQPFDKTGPIGIVGPGTGLGVASLVWDGHKYVVVPGEGGHVTMSAKTQREFDIFRTLRYKYRHVSAERVCSGKGLVNIYNAIRILDGHEGLPDRTPEEIAQRAMEQTCPVCEETLDKMMGFLGTVAGDLGVTLGATGGIFIAGGIPAKLGDYFFNSRFRKEFEAKGRHEDYMQAIPTTLITHPFTAFVGLQKFISGASHA